MKKYDAIVIGSGIGGLAAALQMAHSGRKTVVLEKNHLFGGRLSSYKKEGFTLDIGVHVISRGAKGPATQCLARCGIENALKFTNIRPIVCFEGKTFKFPHDLKDMVPAEDFEALMKFMRDAKSFTQEEIAELDKITEKELLSRYTANETLHTCVSRIGSVYCALPSWLESAGEFVRCLTWEAEAKSSGYPMGGCISITNAYIDGIKKFGGEVLNNMPVERIIVENNRAVGVIAGGQEYRADIIASNADIRNTVLKLAGAAHFPPDYVEYVSKLTYSWAGPVMRIALDQPITDIKMLSQFGEIGQEQYYEKIRRGVMPKYLNIFLVVPSNFDPETAPPGRQLIAVATPLPTDTPTELTPKIQEAVLNTVETFVPELRKHIMWIDSMDIQAMAAIAGEDGCVIGVGQTPGQTGADRPKIKTPLAGLYIVGGEAGGSGVGIENSINSAMNFFDLLNN
ncbi:MAG: NAD(P)/FAD-dependent oxidoreductase [Gracilibacteraceae bacterium]|jgi:phytoene dehydrogenase-like protein|nr:NAD(P)/FAD-dependent oxidoreductase [Gracilibacteraceae bacterium]